MDMDQAEPVDDDTKDEPVEYGVSSRGRRIAKKSYIEPPSEDDMGLDGGVDGDFNSAPLGASATDAHDDAQGDDDDDNHPRYTLRDRKRRSGGNLKGFIASDEDNDEAGVRYSTRSRAKRTSVPPQSTNGRVTRQKSRLSRTRPTSSRRSRRIARTGDDEDGYVDEPSSGTADADVSFDNVHTSPEPEDLDADGEGDLEEPEQDGRPYSLRTRAPINYAIPPPLEAVNDRTTKKPGGGRANGRSGYNKPKSLGWSATGAQLGQWMGLAGDDSVCSVTYSRRK
jgi:ATPase family AAA domain-containing protein 2